MTAESSAGTPASRIFRAETLAPLASPVFRALWFAVLLTNIGNWMETVGAQWLLVSQPNSAILVALVQTADTLPVMIMALPAGVLADVFDRRLLLLGTMVFLAVEAFALTGLTAAGLITPALLLVFTFLGGIGSGVTAPAWQAMIPDLLDRSRLRSAAVLGSVAVNIGRAIGPALAGIIIGVAGVAPVFGLNAATYVVFAVVLVWAPVRNAPSALGREQLVPALRAGGAYVRWSPYTRSVLVRAALFLLPAMAIWALLPLVATDELGLDAAGYGLLLGALGIGAILGVAFLGRIRRRFNDEQLVRISTVVYAAAMAGLVLIPNVVAALVVLVIAGAAWLAVLSTINATLQLFLPGWVRARGLAIYMIVLYGSQAVGAVVWGVVAGSTSLLDAFLIAAVLMLLGAVAGLRVPLNDVSAIDRSSVTPWPEARLAFHPERAAGPVLVNTEYRVASAHAQEFADMMEVVGRARRRTGASSWRLYRDGADPDLFLETFEVPSWDIHLRQHGGRLTGFDAEQEGRAKALATRVKTTRHFFPADDVVEAETNPSADDGSGQAGGAG